MDYELYLKKEKARKEVLANIDSKSNLVALCEEVEAEYHKEKEIPRSGVLDQTSFISYRYVSYCYLLNEILGNTC